MSKKAVRLFRWCMVFLLSVASLVASDDLLLLNAVKKQDKEAVRSLLELNVDVNASQPDGSTALSWAAHRGDLETAELLIQAGAKVDAADEYGRTPLWLACANRHAAMVEKLLRAGANPNTALRSGETALMTAARLGSMDVVELLLAYGADVSAKETEGGQTALMWAVAERHPEVARLLIEHGADVNARTKSGFTPLLFAAQQGDMDSVKILAAAGAELNAATLVEDEPGTTLVSLKGSVPQGTTPLLMAVAGGHKELAEFLLDKGADPNAADLYGYTALHYAVWGPTDMLDLVKELLARGANPNARLVAEPAIDLMSLLGRGRFNIITASQSSAVYKDGSPSWFGATPLWLAAQIGNVDAIRVLVAHGGDPMIPTEDPMDPKLGTTPLLAAAGVGRLISWKEEERVVAQREGRNNLEAVKLLWELGSDVNAVGQNGWTALHGAGSTGENEVVKFLVEKGAKLDAMSKFGETPLSTVLVVPTVGLNAPGVSYILYIGHQLHKDTADLLLELGATPLEESGVQILGAGNTPGAASRVQLDPASSPEAK